MHNSQMSDSESFRPANVIEQANSRRIAQSIVTRYQAPKKNATIGKIVAMYAGQSIECTYWPDLPLKASHVAAAMKLRARLGWNKFSEGRLVTSETEDKECYLHTL
jgi:hypothetical protein